jgi:DNA replication protein DnaC
MLIHPTVERLRALGLSAMADALVAMERNPDAAELPHADWLGLLIDHEATARDNRRLARRLQVAKLRQAASVENVDYRSPRGLDRALFQKLATSQWVRDHQHVAITGPTGTGKSWLVSCLRNFWPRWRFCDSVAVSRRSAWDLGGQRRQV